MSTYPRIRLLVAFLVALLCVPLTTSAGHATGKDKKHDDEKAAAPHKVVVCKYVRTPGDAEQLHHVVIVDQHALDGWDGSTFPTEFSDAHVRSLALRWATAGEQAHDVAPSECPQIGTPPIDEPPVVVPAVHKVVVCKYVATPGERERLSHIVIVDESALPDWDGATFPFAFADAHVRSLALRWAEDGEHARDVPLTACPADEEPPTTMVIEKQDFETGAVLGDATFALYADRAPYADEAAPVVGAEDTLIGSDVTDSNGLAKFAELETGHYLVVETLAPAGYELPDEDTIAVVIDEGNFVAGGEMAAIVFQDFALGQLAIVEKRQYELVDGAWVESDGVADFGDVVKYVVEVEATGPKYFHDVVVSDYVPGFNPDDSTSTVRASLEPGTAVCTGSLECDVEVGDDGLVTWEAGTVHDAAGTVEMVVRIPDVPDNPEFDEEGVYSATLWNVGHLRWQEVTGGTPGGRAGRFAGSALDFTFTEHELTSNEVQLSASLTIDEIVDPPVDDPKDPALPNTGAPAFLAWLAVLGGLVLSVGAGLVHRSRRKSV